jgi:hypothetical protein
MYTTERAHKDTYDYSFYRARADEYNHLMTDSPGASRAGALSAVLAESKIGIFACFFPAQNQQF